MQVTSATPYILEVPPGQYVDYVSGSTDPTVYWSGSPAVSSTNNLGSILQGASQRFGAGGWYLISGGVPAYPMISNPLPVTPLDLTMAETGEFASSVVSAQRALFTEVAGAARFTRFVPSRPLNVKSVGFNVGVAAGSNDNIECAIYSFASTLATCLLLATTGPVAGKVNATGPQKISLTAGIILEPNVPYYVGYGFVAMAGTAAQISGISVPSGLEFRVISAGGAVANDDALAFTGWPANAPANLGATITQAAFTAGAAGVSAGLSLLEV